MRSLFAILPFILFAVSVNAQNYQLIWEDNFNGNSLDSSKWNIEQKIGVWNTGSNQEFQHYKKENVTVGDDGAGNNCLIITAKKEEYDGYHYTSGRVNTKGKFAFKRGKLVASIKIPDLANGLWPAFWTLGYTSTGWPDCGETDILEMGQAEGITSGTQNSFIGSHLFWGPYPRDYGLTYTTSEDLSKGYYKHTVIWDENKISVYFNDSSTPYFSMGITGNDTEEFHDFQNYIIFNLAVGGSVPGIYDQSGITASFPASMYVDWVKLYQETEDITEDNLPLFGSFGIFEDNASVDMRMDLGYDLSVDISGISTRTGETPEAGSQVLSYDIKSGQDFSLKLRAGLTRNMSNYKEGSIQFYMKTNLSGDFQLGVADTTGKEAFVTIGETSGLTITRDGSWQSVYLPLTEIADEVDLSALKDMFIIKGNSVTASYFSIDEIIFSQTAPVEGVYGIYTNNPLITDKFAIDNVTGFLYNWSGTVTFNTNIPAYEGSDVLSFRSSGATNWWGFGIFSSNALNLESYEEGYLHFTLLAKSTEQFKVSVNGANDTKGDITFTNGSDLYGFVRDGKWHQITVPMSILVAQGLDLSACGNIFTMSGGTTTDIGVDDVYLSISETPVDNSATCYAVSLSISPKTPTILTGVKKKFTASATNQFSNAIDATVTWSSSGGTMLQDGYFSATEPGVYTIIAQMDDLSDSTTVTVNTSSTAINMQGQQVQVSYLKSSKSVSIKGMDSGSIVQLFNLSGILVFNSRSSSHEMIIGLGEYPNPVYILKIADNERINVVKFIAQ